MTFVAEKDNGVTLADPDIEDAPIVYANKAFENLTGYSQIDIIGKNCRFLQGQDREQKERFQTLQNRPSHCFQ